MSSKLAKDGYLLIDHRASHMPVPEDMLHKVGLPAQAGKGLFETKTYTCSHCQYIVIMNPERTRERGYCRGCDSYICDPCAAKRAKDFSCKTYAQTLDEAITRAQKGDYGLILP